MGLFAKALTKILSQYSGIGEVLVALKSSRSLLSQIIFVITVARALLYICR